MQEIAVWETETGEMLITTFVNNGKDVDTILLEKTKQKRELFHGPVTLLPIHQISDLPQSRYFRNCWRNDGTGKLHIDMPLAQTQRLNEIRGERDRRLGALDKEWMQAMGQKNDDLADEIEIKRVLLRDIPQIIDLSQIETADELEQFEPAWPE